MNRLDYRSMRDMLDLANSLIGKADTVKARHELSVSWLKRFNGRFEEVEFTRDWLFYIVPLLTEEQEAEEKEFNK